MGHITNREQLTKDIIDKWIWNNRKKVSDFQPEDELLLTSDVLRMLEMAYKYGWSDCCTHFDKNVVIDSYKEDPGYKKRFEVAKNTSFQNRVNVTFKKSSFFVKNNEEPKEETKEDGKP